MYEVDRLEGADHYFELDDLAVVVAGDDVDPIDGRVADVRFELENRVVPVEDLLRVPEGLVRIRGRLIVVVLAIVCITMIVS
mgnify:CR=1 FL=1